MLKPLFVCRCSVTTTANWIAGFVFAYMTPVFLTQLGRHEFGSVHLVDCSFALCKLRHWKDILAVQHVPATHDPICLDVGARNQEHCIGGNAIAIPCPQRSRVHRLCSQSSMRWMLS